MRHIFLALLCLMFGCSAATNQSEKSSPVPVTQLEVPMDGIDARFRLPKDEAARNAIINWLIAGLIATQLWQLRELYKINREIGESNGRLARMSSDTESEKATRARVNALILKQLGVKDASIEEVLRDVRKS